MTPVDRRQRATGDAGAPFPGVPSRGTALPARALLRATTLVFLATALTGCAAWQPRNGFGGGRAGLAVHLAPRPGFDYGGPEHVSFAVNAPAHVAVFSLIPGEAVDVLYPYHRTRGTRFHAGAYQVRTMYGLRGLGYWGLGRFLGGDRPSGTLSGWDPMGAAIRRASGGPRAGYLVVVASTRPLRMERLVGHARFAYGSALLRSRQLAFGSVFSVTDRILDRVLPPGIAPQEWAVDWTHLWIAAPRATGRLAALPRDHGVERDTMGRRLPVLPDTLGVVDLPFAPPRLPDDRVLEKPAAADPPFAPPRSLGTGVVERGKEEARLPVWPPGPGGELVDTGVIERMVRRAPRRAADDRGEWPADGRVPHRWRGVDARPGDPGPATVRRIADPVRRPVPRVGAGGSGEGVPGVRRLAPRRPSPGRPVRRPGVGSRPTLPTAAPVRPVPRVRAPPPPRKTRPRSKRGGSGSGSARGSGGGSGGGGTGQARDPRG